MFMGLPYLLGLDVSFSNEADCPPASGKMSQNQQLLSWSSGKTPMVLRQKPRVSSVRASSFHTSDKTKVTLNATVSTVFTSLALKQCLDVGTRKPRSTERNDEEEYWTRHW